MEKINFNNLLNIFRTITSDDINSFLELNDGHFMKIKTNDEFIDPLIEVFKKNTYSLLLKYLINMRNVDEGKYLFVYQNYENDNINKELYLFYTNDKEKFKKIVNIYRSFNKSFNYREFEDLLKEKGVEYNLNDRLPESYLKIYLQDQLI